MASTIYRLTSLVVIFNIILSGFGSALRITAHPNYYQDTTDSDLNVTCVADGPEYTTKSVEMIQIKRHGQAIPMTTILVQRNHTMEADKKGNMEAVGHIDNYSGKSYLTLIVKNQSVEEVGLYRCLMIVRERNDTFNTESVATYDNLHDRDIKTVLTSLSVQVSCMETRVRELQSVQNETIQTLLEHKQYIDAFKAKRPTTTTLKTTTPTTTASTTTTTTTTSTTTTPTTTTSTTTRTQATISKECVKIKITECPEQINKRFCSRWFAKAQHKQFDRCGGNIIENE